ncbi:hypothetical protein P8452_46527 [Trifolium repens]|nr:hypothetical protein P8452_46527 [Trifolium repens]
MAAMKIQEESEATGTTYIDGPNQNNYGKGHQEDNSQRNKFRRQTPTAGQVGMVVDKSVLESIDGTQLTAKRPRLEAENNLIKDTTMAGPAEQASQAP